MVRVIENVIIIITRYNISFNYILHMQPTEIWAVYAWCKKSLSVSFYVFQWLSASLSMSVTISDFEVSMSMSVSVSGGIWVCQCVHLRVIQCLVSVYYLSWFSLGWFCLSFTVSDWFCVCVSDCGCVYVWACEWVCVCLILCMWWLCVCANTSLNGPHNGRSQYNCPQLWQQSVLLHLIKLLHCWANFLLRWL